MDTRCLAASFQVVPIVTCSDDGRNMRPPHVWLVAKAVCPNVIDNTLSKEI
jgi:hypothetical protein